MTLTLGNPTPHLVEIDGRKFSVPPQVAGEIRRLREAYIADRLVIGCECPRCDAALLTKAPDREAMATLVMRWRCDCDDGEWPEDKAAEIMSHASKPHLGDCTNYPMTCLRCEADAAYKMADQIIALSSQQGPSDGEQDEPIAAGAVGPQILQGDDHDHG